MSDQHDRELEPPEEIAIIGMAGRFPGAKNTEEYWHNLREGVESIRTFTEEELMAAGFDQATFDDPSYVNAGAILDDADTFDADFFGINPREAEIMDPQHRVLLECAWEALENAGYDPETFDGSIGVFGGVAPNTYFQNNLVSRTEILDAVGHYPAMIATEKEYSVTRISFKLNLKGPSIFLNTACSTSGVAIHVACQSVLSGECDMALAGGCRIKVPLKAGYLYIEDGIMSPDGHCRAFDAKAHGTVVGSGVAMIAIKPLSDAFRDKDTIYAVIKGTAINNDGFAKVGFTAPSSQGQALCIEEAMAVAEISPETIGYVEAHGTGTSLGDPIEIAALTKAYRKSTNLKNYCAIGSVKTNIGHLDAGAGVAGIIKAALALKHRQIPPSLNFEEPNPQIDFANSPFYVNDELSEWPRNEHPRRAGVSSFGLGGTNAHIILEEAPSIKPSSSDKPWHLLVLSARTENALNRATENLVMHFRNHPGLNLSDVAHTLQLGRRAFNHRRIVVCQNINDAVAAMETLDPKRVATEVQKVENPTVVFMFSGQGSQYVHMASELYWNESIFREQVDTCAEFLKPHLELDIRHVLYPHDVKDNKASQQLDQTRITQPALFVIEYALAKLWMAWGVQPQAMIGHSIGEYVAACLAGVFSLQDALDLVAARGSLMQQLPEGAMLAVPLPENEVQILLGDQLSLAAVNGTSLCVVSGPIDAVEALQDQLAERDVETRRLHTSHAFHSEMVEPILVAFGERVKKVNLSPPQIPYISNVSGTWIGKAEATDSNYWAKHIRQTVRFSDGLQVLLQDSNQVLLEVGAGQTLSTFARRHPAKARGQTIIPSLRHPKEQIPDMAFMLNSLGRLWLSGMKVDWSQLYTRESRRRVPLPTYPFERKRYWIEAATPGEGAEVNLSAATEVAPEMEENLKPDDHEMEQTPSTTRKERIIPELNSLIEDLSGIEPTDIDINASFLELGFDSLLLTQANAAFKRKFDVKLSFRQLFEETPTVNALAEYIDSRLPPDAFPDETPRPSPTQLISQTAPLVPTDSPPGGSASDSNQGMSATSENPGGNIAAALEGLIVQQIQANTQLLEILKDRNLHQGLLQPPPTQAQLQPAVTEIKKGDYSEHDMAVRREYWDLDIEAELSALGRRESELEKELGIKGMDAYDGLESDLNDLCSAYVCRYFESCDINISYGSSYEVSELQKTLKILPKFEKFFHYMLEILSEDRITEVGNGRVKFLQDEASLKDPQSLTNSLMNNHPQFSGIFEMLDHCVKHYRDALSGNMPAIQVLFPDGTRDLIKKNLEDNTVEYRSLRIYAFLAKELILKLSANSPLRILEVGAGSGSLTWQLAPVLQGRDAEYYFTDIGRAFVINAKKEAARRGLGMMEFEVLDIAKDPEKQGFEPESFDIILGLNVVHATPDIEATLGNLKKLLVPRGFICLIESIKAHRWTNLVWGTTEGWWYFHDCYREDVPLVDLSQWEKASRNQNFGYVHALPVDGVKRSTADSGLILAMREDPLTIRKETTTSKGVRSASVGGEPSGLGPWKPVERRSSRLSDIQQQHLEALVNRFTNRTRESKRLTQAYRAKLADPRTAAGFQLPWKELVYPIVVSKSAGSKLWDVDGNEWLDITMGFGVSLFGHSPPFIVEAIEKQLKDTMATGPQTILAGEVAELVCELTGMERVAFCNTGSEAVLAAIRIARNVTGCERIALFSGAYRGIFDEVLVKGISSKGRQLSIPVAAGIPRKAVEDVLVLEYGDFNSLDIIKNHASELAAVLVEPIQSRNPEIQPKEFLHALRELTEKQNIPLIFDEMITGFRLDLGGAQAYFGVNADIAAYGKVVGGSMPIGIVAGKSEYMDALDGGMWNFGDDSVPEVGTTWFAGTFVRHPLSLAAAHAALKHLKNSGQKLLDEVNRRTSRFANDLNHYFEQIRMPVRIPHFGTLFLIKFIENQQFSGLFWHFLRDNGIHCHESRPNYLTTAHTKEDVDFLLEAFKKTAEEMRAGGFIPEASTLEPSEKKIISTSDSLPPSESAKAPEAGFREIPLTDAQLEIWLATCLGDEASCAFNVSTSLHLIGPLQIEPLRVAMNQVCYRHEALRTTISKNGDYQRIDDEIEINMPIADLSGLKPDEQEAEIKIFRKNEVEKPFDLVEGPLIRARIIKLAQNQHYLMFTAHHIICDGWSLEIILQDLSAFYSLSIGLARVKFKEAVQFSNFIALLRDHQNDTSQTDTETYWLGRFSDSAPALEFPIDRPRPPIKTYSCNHRSLVIDSKQFKELGRFATANGCTIFSTLLAAYCILVRCLSNQEDIVVGLAAGGQSAVGNKKLVGHCVNLLPIRNRVSADQKFLEYLAAVRNLLFEAFEYQHYSFGSLIKKLNLPRDLSRIPLISTIITYETSAKGVQFEGLDANITPNLRSFCNFDLELYLRETDDTLTIRFDYNTDLFDDSTIHRWLKNYQTLLAGIVADPNREIGKLPILPESERNQLMTWNLTHVEYPRDMCLHQLFEAQVERTPDAVALVTEAEELTYSQLNNRANQVARRIISLGVEPDAIVGVFLNRSASTIAAILGILKSGAAYMPLDPDYPKDRLAFMLSDSQAQVLVTENQLESQLPDNCPEVLYLDTNSKEAGQDNIDNPQTAVQQNSLAYVLYTSGSTGIPKGVAIEHHSPVALVSWAREVFTEEEMAGVLFSTSICFDLSVFEIFSPLTVGGKVILADNLLELPSLKASSEVTLINTVPSAIAELLRTEGVPPSVCTVNLAGELLKTSLVQKIYEVKSIQRVYDLYGPSEDTTYSTWVLRTSDGHQTIGRPISNTQAYVLDQQRQLAPIGVIGELYLGGDGLARGYLHRPELTAEKFTKNPFDDGNCPRLYATGDLVRYLPDGNLVYMGRIDHQVKIRGFRIELGEIEAVLADHPGVKDQVVVTHELKPEDSRIIAYVVPHSKDISIPELRAHLATRLPVYMIPSSFVKLDALPLTPNGKVDRKALPALDNFRPELEATYVEPKKDSECAIADIWKEVLDLKKVGVHDNFFELGGHSLLATQVISRLNSFFHLNLELFRMFETPTVAELAEAIEEKLWKEIDSLTEEDAERLLLEGEKEDA